MEAGGPFHIQPSSPGTFRTRTRLSEARPGGGGSIVSGRSGTPAARNLFHDLRLRRSRAVTPEEREDGGAPHDGGEPGASSETPPETPESAQTRAEGVARDEVTMTRERVEEALRRRGSQVAPDSEPAHERTRSSALHPPPEASSSEHWSWTVRRRVTDGIPDGGPGDAPAPPDEEAAGEESSSDSRTAEIRERVERRLQEAEDRRAARVASLEVASTAPSGTGTRHVSVPGSQPPSEGMEADDWDSPWAEGEGEAPPPAEGSAGGSPSRLAAFIATCASLGRLPLAPGTFGAAAGLVAFALTRELAGTVSLGLFAIAVVAGTWAAGRHAKDVRQKDPQSVVVDEFCGMWLALLGTTPSLLAAGIAFLAFRLLDILKPPPIRQAERLPGGIGIMADDLLAGGIVRLGVLLILGM